MPDNDPIHEYMQLPLADRWAIDRLLPPNARRQLKANVRARLELARQHAKRASDPAAALACSSILARRLAAIASEDGSLDVTPHVRQATRLALAHALETP